MNRLGRALFGLGGRISKQQAYEVAHAECVRRGLPWMEPVRVYRHYGNWAVWTFANHRGGNVRVIVDRRSGEVLAVLGPTLR